MIVAIVGDPNCRLHGKPLLLHADGNNVVLACEECRAQKLDELAPVTTTAGNMAALLDDAPYTNAVAGESPLYGPNHRQRGLR